MLLVSYGNKLEERIQIALFFNAHFLSMLWSNRLAYFGPLVSNGKMSGLYWLNSPQEGFLVFFLGVASFVINHGY